MTIWANRRASAAHRNGFQKLVADVAMGQVGIVMGLEMSRLARNNADFQQLLQLCGTNNTLIYDADALYDLMRLNDRSRARIQGHHVGRRIIYHAGRDYRAVR